MKFLSFLITLTLAFTVLSTPAFSQEEGEYMDEAPAIISENVMADDSYEDEDNDAYTQDESADVYQEETLDDAPIYFITEEDLNALPEESKNILLERMKNRIAEMDDWDDEEENDNESDIMENDI